MRFDGSDVTEATGFDSDVLSAVGMARRGDLLCSIAMMILLGLLMCSVVRAGPLPSGLSDLQDIPALSEIECPKTGAKPLTADSPPEVEGLPKGATLTYAQALDDLKDALEGSVSPEAIKALDSLEQAKDPLAATAIAAASLVKEKPLATVAFLIKAHEAAPTEPVYLANLSGIANYVGFHREALAFAEKAEALPKVKMLSASQHAVLLSNKGYALVSLGRPQEAEAVLKEAIRLDADLSEAYTNMAYSLGDQDKCEQAAHYLRAGMFRHPSDVFKIKDPMQKRIPLSRVIDLSKGKVGVLPPVPIASSPEDVAAVGKQLEVLGTYANELTQGDEGKEGDAMAGIMFARMRWAKEGVAGMLTANFAELLLKTMNIYTIEITEFHQNWLGGEEQGAHQDPELLPLAAATVRADYKMISLIQGEGVTWDPRNHAIQHEYDQKMSSCQKQRDPGSCEALAMLKRDSAICSLGKELGAKREQAAREYDRALRELYAESYRRASALAAYYSEPAHKEWARLTLQNYAAQTLKRLLVNSARGGDIYARVVESCKAANKTPQDILFERLKEMMKECEEESEAKAGFSVLEVSASCEKVEIGASTPGAVGLFGKVGYEFSQRYRRITDPKERFKAQQAGRDPDVALNLPGYGGAFDGKLTLTGGVQAKVGVGEGVEVGAQVGGHLTLDGQGNITNVGGDIKVTASVEGGGGFGKAEVSASATSGSKGTEYSGSASASSAASVSSVSSDSVPLFAPSFGTDD